MPKRGPGRAGNLDTQEGFKKIKISITFLHTRLIGRNIGRNIFLVRETVFVYDMF